jgi:EAL domain-containing protein (putative c-di-GMP-specific phosphodiesterase class I)
MGVRIAIDDFGTGYSNFSYLLKLKPDYLKIDGSIIKNIDKDKNSEAIVEAIISFAKTLHVKTIAEFIHSKEVYDKCYKLGIDEFQGFYLGEPNPDLV